MLDEHHTDRRQLADLVAAKPPAPTALGNSKSSATRLRIMIDDLIHLTLGVEIATPHPDARAAHQPDVAHLHDAKAFARASSRRCARDFSRS